MLSDPSFDVVFDDVILGENHALFDLTRIAQVLTELISEFGDPVFVNEAKLCEDLLNTIVYPLYSLIFHKKQLMLPVAHNEPCLCVSKGNE